MLFNRILISSFSQQFRRYATAMAEPTIIGKSQSKPNVNVGTIGHIDHGKTTLTAAITKYLSQKGKTKFMNFDQIDKAKEEKRRGITINASHINYETPVRRYAHTDCPGHRDFVKNMICGTAQMDFAVLVIAATDGVMVQTREHLLLAQQIGLKDVIVFINKADCVELDDLELVEIEARELLTRHGYNGERAAVIKGSALRALELEDDKCMQELISVMDSMPLPERLQDDPFIMPISSAMSIQGRGTVIIGTLESGTLTKNDLIEIKGFDAEIKTRVADIQVFGKSIPQVTAGEHCGVLCRKLPADAVVRGMCAGSPGVIKTTNVLGVQLYMLDESEGGSSTGIRSDFTDHVFCGVWEQAGRLGISSIGDGLLMPGEHSTGHLVFIRDVPVRKNMSFTIRRGKNQTMARGIITDLYKPIFVDSFRKMVVNEFVKKAVLMEDDGETKSKTAGKET